jgi:adapter protein MecA 1/2
VKKTIKQKDERGSEPMRIEKISEKQIRCTLNQKDLKDREIGISELAYGTAKAKALFRDMMQQASYEFGFDADDIPLMIEAIPLLPEALILVITKVEEPDELDTRFSCFTEERDWTEEDEEFLYDGIDSYEDEDEFLAFDSHGDIDDERIWDFSGQSSPSSLLDSPEQKIPLEEPDFISLPEALGMEPRPKEYTTKKLRDVVMIFTFTDLNTVTRLANHISPLYYGENTLFKNPSTGAYYLVLHRSDHEAEEFSKICNILYEYGTIIKNSGSMQHYYEEHFKPIIEKDAVHVLAAL